MPETTRCPRTVPDTRSKPMPLPPSKRPATSHCTQPSLLPGGRRIEIQHPPALRAVPVKTRAFEQALPEARRPSFHPGGKSDWNRSASGASEETGEAPVREAARSTQATAIGLSAETARKSATPDRKALQPQARTLRAVRQPAPARPPENSAERTDRTTRETIAEKAPPHPAGAKAARSQTSAPARNNKAARFSGTAGHKSYGSNSPMISNPAE